MMPGSKSFFKQKKKTEKQKIQEKKTGPRTREQ